MAGPRGGDGTSISSSADAAEEGGSPVPSLEARMTNFASFPTASRRPRGCPPIAAADGFTVNIVSDAPVHVLADQNEIFRVLFNLLHNALTVARAAPRLRRIDISVERAGRIVVLRIADNGGGLPRKVAERCFRRPAAGAIHGFGLAIARELMERNGGTLSCETSAKGTTFRLELAGGFLNRAANGPVTHLLGRRAMIR